MILHLATTNPGKLRDFANALTSGFELKVLPGIEAMPEPEETATTFEGNARIKAEAYSLAAPGLYVLADDSGLEVDALNGAPGVRSARYADDLRFAGTGTKDERNNAALLDALAGRPSHGRYRCVLALARDGKVLAVNDGSVEGELLPVPRGANGFGYDPLFELSDLGLSMAEIDLAARQKHSHRALALADLLQSIGTRRAEATRRRRTSAIMAAVPAAFTAAGALGSVLAMSLLLYGLHRDGEIHGVALSQRKLVHSLTASLLLGGVCVWAALRALRSRAALWSCGLLACAFLVAGVYAFLEEVLPAKIDPTSRIFSLIWFCTPLLGLGALGLRGTTAALRSTQLHDIANMTVIAPAIRIP